MKARIKNFTQYRAPSWGSVNSSSYYYNTRSSYYYNTREGVWEIKMLHELNILLVLIYFIGPQLRHN